MTNIFKKCNDATRTEITLGAYYKASCKARELIKLLTRVRTVCKGSNNGGLLFGAHVSKIVKQNFWSVQSLEELLGSHSMNDAIWDHIDPCNVSIDTVDNA